MLWKLEKKKSGSVTVTFDKPPPISSTSSAASQSFDIMATADRRQKAPHKKMRSWQNIWFDFRVPCHFVPPSLRHIDGITTVKICTKTFMCDCNSIWSVCVRFGFGAVRFSSMSARRQIFGRGEREGEGGGRKDGEASTSARFRLHPILPCGSCCLDIVLWVYFWEASRCFSEQTHNVCEGARVEQAGAFYLILVSKQMCVCVSYFFVVGCGWIDRQCTYVVLSICLDHH